MNNRAIITLIFGISFVVGCIAQVEVLDSCIVCSSRTNLSCATDPQSYRITTCQSDPLLLGCYTRIIDGFTLRGCASELNADVLTACRNNNDNCSICVGPPHTPTFGCNNQIVTNAS